MNGFNAFRYVEELRESGVPEKQAEAHLRILHDIVESNLATKRDIRELEQRMVIKLGGLMVIGIGVVAVLITPASP